MKLESKQHWTIGHVINLPHRNSKLLIRHVHLLGMLNWAGYTRFRRALHRPIGWSEVLHFHSETKISTIAIWNSMEPIRYSKRIHRTAKTEWWVVEKLIAPSISMNLNMIWNILQISGKISHSKKHAAYDEKELSIRTKRCCHIRYQSNNSKSNGIINKRWP